MAQRHITQRALIAAREIVSAGERLTPEAICDRSGLALGDIDDALRVSFRRQGLKIERATTNADRVHAAIKAILARGEEPAMCRIRAITGLCKQSIHSARHHLYAKGIITAYELLAGEDREADGPDPSPAERAAIEARIAKIRDHKRRKGEPPCDRHWPAHVGRVVLNRTSRYSHQRFPSDDPTTFGQEEAL